MFHRGRAKLRNHLWININQGIFWVLLSFEIVSHFFSRYIFTLKIFLCFFSSADISEKGTLQNYTDAIIHCMSVKKGLNSHKAIALQCIVMVHVLFLLLLLLIAERVIFSNVRFFYDKFIFTDSTKLRATSHQIPVYEKDCVFVCAWARVEQKSA